MPEIAQKELQNTIELRKKPESKPRSGLTFNLHRHICIVEASRVQIKTKNNWLK
jgi:hypothetical protein